MTDSNWDEFGWPAEPPRVYATTARRNEAGVRRAELFPQRFDSDGRFSEPAETPRPSRIEPGMENFMRLLEERRRYG